MGLFFGRKRRARSRSIVSNIPFLRFLGPGLSGAGILGALAMILSGQIDLSSLDVLRGSIDPSGGQPAQVQPVVLTSLGQKPSETVRIATFNIQVFGKTKASDTAVMSVLAKVMSQFDVIAVQEVRGSDADAVQKLIDLLRASGADYSATVSAPIGRTSQKESYTFIWDNSRIQLVPQSAYVVQDAADRMHREPMVASFESRVSFADGRRPFRFTLINAHTDPDEVRRSAANNEMNVLDDVFVRVRQYDYETFGEEDCILLGDLNVDQKGLAELGRIPGVVSIAGDIKTNTRGTKTYDHILIDPSVTSEYTGRFGLIDFQRDFGLSQEQALRVSDHLPLWAEFTAYEMPRFNAVAETPQEGTRMAR